MPDVYVLSTFWDVLWATLIVMIIFVPLTLLWVFALMDLFGRRDIRWLKVTWLVLIIFLPIFGPLIYLLVRPEQQTTLVGRDG